MNSNRRRYYHHFCNRKIIVIKRSSRVVPLFVLRFCAVSVVSIIISSYLLAHLSVLLRIIIIIIIWPGQSFSVFQVLGALSGV